jgi:hypothetical protein
MFLILIDAYSKWMEVFPMNTSTSSATIEKLRTVFATHGLPEKLVSDNGSCFTSEEFEQFLVKNGIKHVTSAPYHPASNGLAERAVQTFKEGMKKMKEGSIETKVSRFLFKYRITPQTTTGVAPAELLMGRKPLSRLDLLTPDVGRRVEKKQQDQKQRHDSHAKERSFKVGDLVYARNYAQGEKWIPGRIEQRTGPVSFTVELGENRKVRRHQDQIFARENNEQLEERTFIRDNEKELSGEPIVEDLEDQLSNDGNRDTVAGVEHPTEVTARRYPVRQRQSPDYYGHN